MFAIIIFCVIISNFGDVIAQDIRLVVLEEGAVQAEKYWDGDFYEFYGVPYALAPTGRDRYKAPLPVKPWNGIIDANVRNIICQQSFFTANEDEEALVSGEEDCLVMNILVPKVASEKNLLPVVVYIHSGAYAGGNGNMARFHSLAKRDLVVVNFNYRLGALGFACLGTKDVPGNAGLKDQVAALKFIKKNIKKFGGDPSKITLAGFSVGAAMAELLALSKTTDGIIDKLILESASALSPFAINADPISTARNIALSIGYNDTGKIEDLNEFYLKASDASLAIKSLNFFIPNSTFGFAPCIENAYENTEPFLTEAPIDIINRGDYKKVSLLTGFSNMEGLSRISQFNTWSELMNEKFSDFLAADLTFKDEKEKEEVIKKIKEVYFKGEEVTHDTLQGYVDYFSDAMFKYSIMKSAKLHSAKTERPVFVYEFSYVGDLSMKHHYMDKIRGASHRDQSSYILDFFSFTSNHTDMDVRDRMSLMWSDFVKYENPTAYESVLVNYRWPKFSIKDQKYLQIDHKPQVMKDLFEKGYQFWNTIYEKHYWKPTAPKVAVKN